VGENVRGLTNWNGGLVFDEVQAELEAQGYEVTPFLLPACAVNAPHRRDRIWFVAFKNTNRNGWPSDIGQSESCERKQWDTCTGNNERISTNNEEAFDAADSDLLRRDKCIQYDEVNTSEGGINALSDINKSDVNGDAPNSMRIRLEHTKETRDISESERKTRTKRSESSKSFEANGINGNVTDSQSERLQGMHQARRKDINNRENTEIRRGLTGYYKKNKWTNFPTVSPICDGDDGISHRLDSITFSKWRNESIKAGGNAIVPQVVHQIFKAIEQYNELNKQLSI
jgi:DNA (cytosine-5)-methyltransferase 1